MCVSFGGRREGCVALVHVDDSIAVGKERCDRFGDDLGRLVPVKALGEL